MDRIGSTWIRIGSVMALNCPEMDSCENRSGSDWSDMDSVWVRSGLVLTRHGCVREPIWVGAVRYGSDWTRFGFVLNRIRFTRSPICIGSVRHEFGLVPPWLRIAPKWVRVRAAMDRIGPIWIRIGSVLDLHRSDMDSCENRYGSERSEMVRIRSTRGLH